MDTIRDRVLIKIADGNIILIGSTIPIDVVILDCDIRQTEFTDGVMYQDQDIIMDDQDMENVIKCFTSW